MLSCAIQSSAVPSGMMSFRIRELTCVLASVFCPHHCAAPCLYQPVKVEDLAKPPANVHEYTILSTAGVHGHSYSWTDSQGMRYGRESLLLRGQIFESDSQARLGADGMLDHLLIRGFTPQGDAAEGFDVKNGVASWKSPIDSGSAKYQPPTMYSKFGGPLDLTIVFAEALIAAPSRSLPLLPGGEAYAAPLTTLSVGSGASKMTVYAYAVTGISNSPVPIWMDSEGKFFALDQGLVWIRKGYEADKPQLDKAQDDRLAQYSLAIAKNLPKVPKDPVAFTHVKAFVDGTRFVEDQTVIVDHGVITEIGSSAETATPARAKAQLLMPHFYPSMLIDGKGPNTAQVGRAATSQDEAIAIVRQAKADGFAAIKIYGSFNPAWVEATAAEAHRLGLHVHGHVPAGMRPLEAIHDGYDEITHIYFVIMQRMPDAVVDQSNGIARMQGPGRYAKDVDLNAEPMNSLIATMAERKIVSDPTLVVAESLYVPENGDLSAAYAPYMGTLPPTVERDFRTGGVAVAARPV